MARECQVCGKSSQVGNQVTTRGKKKYLGGVGTKITGCTRRKFKPNLQRVHVALPTGGNKHLMVCVQCIRTGKIKKSGSSRSFQDPNCIWKIVFGSRRFAFIYNKKVYGRSICKTPIQYVQMTSIRFLRS